MRCGHCKDSGPQINVAHVRACSTYEAGIRSIGREAPAPVHPRVTNARRIPVTEPGVYFRDGAYFKVVQAQKGHLYAKGWVEQEQEWQYAPGGISRLSADMKVTAEQAARFGRLWGNCVFCSRLLTDERSVSVGYGPVCAEHNGLPWGESVGA